MIWTELNGQIVLTTRHQQVEQAERFFAAMMTGYNGGSLADELIAERRAEAAHEDAV